MRMNQTDLLKELTNLTTIMYRLKRADSRFRDSEDMCSISGIQLQTMVMLTENETLNMTVLANKMLMTRQQLTKIIDVLVEKGLVVRGDDPNNRKHVMIRISEDGEKFMKELILSRHNKMSQMVMALDEEDAQKMLDAIVVIREVLEKLDLTRAK